MKHALALLPALVCGCIVEAPPPRMIGGPAESVYFATWMTVDARGVPGDCKQVADVVRITADDTLTGQRSVFNFDCRANRGDVGTAFLPGSTVRLELVDCEGSFCVEGGTSLSSLSVEAGAPKVGADVDLGPFAFEAL
jgi:hypothetical protein